MSPVIKRFNESTFEEALIKFIKDPTKVFYRQDGECFWVMYLKDGNVRFTSTEELGKHLNLHEESSTGYINRLDRDGKWFEIRVEHPHDIKHESLLVVFDNEHFRQASSLGFRNYSVNQALEAEGVHYGEAFAMFAVNGSEDIKQVYSKGETNA